MDVGTIEIVTLTDDVLDPGETLIVTLDDATTAAGAAEVGTPAAATVTITDDGMDTVSVAATTASTVTEGGNAEFTVRLTGRAAADTVLVWSTAGGDGSDLGLATSGTDFTGVSEGALTIPAGETTGILSVTTLQDSRAEASETFTVTIARTSLPSGVTLGVAEATGTIRDDETLTVRVAAGSATVVRAARRSSR